MTGDSLSYEEALSLYDALGVNVIPLRARDKRPIGDWAAYQSRASSPEERALWWPAGASQANRLNIGVVTGAISNLLVLDLDNEATYEYVTEHIPWLRESLICRTGRGWHIYLRPTSPAGRTTTFRLNDALHHIKSDGGYVVAPPSIHPSGSVYTFESVETPPLDVDPAILAKALTAIGAAKAQPETTDGQKPQDWVTELLRADCYQGGAGPGGGKGRDDTAAQLAGWFRNVIVYRRDVTLEILRMWNEQHCKPPLPARDIERIVNHKYQMYPPPAAPLG